MTTGELALDAYPSAGMRAGARRSAVRAGLWLSCNRAAGFKAGIMRGVKLPAFAGCDICRAEFFQFLVMMGLMSQSCPWCGRRERVKAGWGEEQYST